MRTVNTTNADQRIATFLALRKRQLNDPLHFAIRHEEVANEKSMRMAVRGKLSFSAMLNYPFASSTYSDLGLEEEAERTFQRAKFHVKELFGVDLRK